MFILGAEAVCRIATTRSRFPASNSGAHAKASITLRWHFQVLFGHEGHDTYCVAGMGL